MATAHPSSVPPGGAQFPPTLWSVVLLAGQNPSPQSEQALATLCRTYWYPLYAFIRRQGHNPHDAQDLTQGFFVHLLEHHRLGQVRREKGKFRSFLLASLRNFLADQRDKAQTQKRGGQASIISLDAQTAEDSYRLEPADTLDSEKLFERRWALTVLQRALDRLEAEYASRGMQERFHQLQRLLLGEDGSATYSEIGNRLGMSEGAVKMAVLRLRQRGRELFRTEIAATVATEEEIDDEVRNLSAVLAG
jgi:RNA polymerase sigma-70 factor (ECF subfamily)